MNSAGNRKKDFIDIQRVLFYDATLSLCQVIIEPEIFVYNNPSLKYQHEVFAATCSILPPNRFLKHRNRRYMGCLKKQLRMFSC